MSQYVQILGSAGADHPPSIVLSLDTHRYIINTGEGSQRLCTQHGIRLGRVHHLLYTRASVSTLGGFPGLSITLADLGVQHLIVYGVKGTAAFIEGIKAFSIRQKMKIDIQEIPETQEGGIIVKDQQITIKAIHMGSRYRKMRSTSQEYQPRYQQPYQPHQHHNGHQPPVNYDKRISDYNAKKLRSLPSLNEDDEAIAAHDDESPSVVETGHASLNGFTIGNSVLSYIFELSSVPGKFDPAKAKSLGLKPGPIFAQLKAGQSVEIKIGDTTRIIEPHECVGPVRPGAVFAIIDLPFRKPTHLMNNWIQRLRYNQQFSLYQQQQQQSPTSPHIDLIYHLCDLCVLTHPSYIEWMQLFGADTHHVFINHSLSPQRSLFTSSAIQLEKLQIVAPSLFTAPSSCLLEADTANKDSESQQQSFLSLKQQQQFPANSVIGISLMKYSLLPSVAPLPLSFSPPALPVDEAANIIARLKQLQHEAHSIQQPHQSDFSSNMILSAEAINAISADIGLLAAPTPGSDGAVDGDFRASPTVLSDLSALTSDESPELVFLGTGSAIPSKYRNVTGIFFHTGRQSSRAYKPLQSVSASSISSSGRSGGFLLDCGEGTLGQCIRKWGVSEATQRIASLSLVFISHLHADHHLGLLSIIQLFKETEAERRRQQQQQHGSVEKRKLHIVGPRRLLPWLIISWTQTYEEQIRQDADELDQESQEESKRAHIVYEELVNEDDAHIVEDDLLDWIQFFPSHECISATPNELTSSLASLSLTNNTPLSSVRTAAVRHCVDAYGLIVDTSSPHPHKLVYSGDTLPCQSLIDAGADATVLIHEATFSADLNQEARLKKHSTITQAIAVAALMRAQRIILTHFSQRYPKLPQGLDEQHTLQAFARKTSILAFDLMTIPFNQLAWLPYLTPIIAAVFTDADTMEEANEEIEEEKSMTEGDTNEMKESASMTNPVLQMSTSVCQPLGKRKLDSS